MSLRMSKITDEQYEQEWMRKALEAQQLEAEMAGQGGSEAMETAMLTTEGDGSDHYTGERENEQIYCNIQQIIPGLFIGDYTAALDGALLREKGISFIVAASECSNPKLSSCSL